MGWQADLSLFEEKNQMGSKIEHKFFFGACIWAENMLKCRPAAMRRIFLSSGAASSLS